MAPVAVVRRGCLTPSLGAAASRHRVTSARDAGAGQTPLAAPRTPGKAGVPAGRRQPSGRGPNSPLRGSDSGPLSVSQG